MDPTQRVRRSPRRPERAPQGRPWPWTDPLGRLSPLKALCFTLLFLPLAIIIARTLAGTLGPRPVTELIHLTGLWGLRLLALSLAVTPLRAILASPKLIQLRRMIGVSAFAYLAAHFCLYAIDLDFAWAKIGAELVTRIYLVIGLTALAILSALAATSTDAMLRRLGPRRWKLLHRGSYVAVLLGAIHFFMQSKFDVSEPTLMAGLLIWAAGWRLLDAFAPAGWSRRITPLIVLALVAALLTAAGEAAGYGLFTPIDGWRVWHANGNFAAGLRPAWWVLAGTLGLAGCALPWRRLQRSSRRSSHSMARP